ncbi:hypothetical protein OSTOST_18861 [Ostertagia ostertagi]
MPRACDASELGTPGPSLSSSYVFCRIMDDSWGCEQDFFAVSPFGGSQTLNELVDGLTSRKPTSTDTISYKSAPTDDVQVVPCVIRKKPRFAPKILKKKSSLNKVSKEPNVKHVTFEVQWASGVVSREGNIQDRSAARERLVMSLGGKAPKGRAVNYKILKKERKEKKEEETKKAAEMKALLRVNPAKKKRK